MTDPGDYAKARQAIAALSEALLTIAWPQPGGGEVSGFDIYGPMLAQVGALVDAHSKVVHAEQIARPLQMAVRAKLPCGATLDHEARDAAPCPDPYCRACRDHTGEVLDYADLLIDAMDPR